MTKPSKPSKPTTDTKPAKRKPVKRRMAIRPTDEQIAKAESIAAKHSAFGVTPPAKAVLEEALHKGLQVLSGE